MKCFCQKKLPWNFEQATELININTDAALDKFNDGINRAGECMKKTITLGKIKKQSVV